MYWESDARMDVGEGERDPPDHCDGEPDLPLQHYHTRTRVHHPHPLPRHTRLRCCPGNNRNRTWSMCFARQVPFTNFQFFRRNNFFRALFLNILTRKSWTWTQTCYDMLYYVLLFQLLYIEHIYCSRNLWAYRYFTVVKAKMFMIRNKWVKKWLKKNRINCDKNNQNLRWRNSQDYKCKCN